MDFEHSAWIVDEHKHAACDACLRLAVQERTGKDPGPICVFGEEFEPADLERAIELMKGYPVNRREFLVERDVRR